jgi:hypothetical protein
MEVSSDGSTKVGSSSEKFQQQRQDASPFRFMANLGRPKKKRRSQLACIECRRRKVRCDIVEQKPKFCTNCRLDGVKCEVKEHKKPR